MSAQENKQLIQKILNDYIEGNAETFLNALAEDVVFETARYPQDILKIKGPYCGKESVLEFFGLVVQYFETLAFEPREYIAEDDKVVVLMYGKDRVKATGKEIEQDFVQIWTVRDGKIVQCKLVEDTYAILEAFKN